MVPISLWREARQRALIPALMSSEMVLLMTGCNSGPGSHIPWSSVGPVLVVFGIWILGLIGYALRTLVKGRYRSSRVDKMGGTRLLSAWLMEYGYWMIRGPANLFEAL